MAGFHKGSSGSPFHTEYYANQGMDTGPGGQTAERGPNVGPGTLAKRVTADIQKNQKKKDSANSDSGY